MRILVAEDSPTTRVMLEGTLAQWGYDVIVASDGDEAWEILQREDAPKLVILDWMMPGMEGVEVCQKIREVASPNPIWIIMLTSKDPTEYMVEAIESGADDFVAKPFNNDELRIRLQVGFRILQAQPELAELAGYWYLPNGQRVGPLPADPYHVKRYRDQHWTMRPPADIAEMSSN